MRPILVSSALAVLAAASPARPADPQAALARFKEVTGGARWDAVTSVHATLAVAASGMHGRTETWDDVVRPRYLTRYQLGPLRGAEGFDGRRVWTQDTSGQVRVEEGGESREASADEAYRRSLAYWYPQRWQAKVEDGGEKVEGAHRFAVVRVTPKGGRPFDMWFDVATGLLDRTVEKAAIETRTVLFSDYRAVNGLEVPHASRSTNGDEKYDQRFTLEHVAFGEPMEAARFEPPPPPPPDFAIAGGKAATTVPFELLNNHIYLKVRLNGKGPYLLLCDTGGANIVMPELAKELGLKPEGALQGRGVGEKSEDTGLVKVASVAVGDATLRDQLFLVLPLGNWQEVEGVAGLGLIGYEVFKRFVATIDYERRRLTLGLHGAYPSRPDAIAVPFKFNNHIPQVEGTLDGIPGAFDLDTGARDSLSLLVPFVEKNDLKARYAPRFQGVTGWGVGGPSRGLVTRAKLLTLGGVRVERPVTELSVQSKGAFTDRYVAGNVGGGTLKRFTVTFDYAKQVVTFEPNASFARPDTFDRAGLWMNLVRDRFQVMDVIAGGPAAEAGLRVGDAIAAIDGRAVSELTLPGVRERFKTDPPGTKVRLTVQSKGATRELTLVLRDLV
jgi:Aspartyl protease/PDZ domain